MDKKFLLGRNDNKAKGTKKCVIKQRLKFNEYEIKIAY